ncbi:hypothetical protein KAFR_0K01490 [Kazachstania africana CBS 2517]|uniref:Phenolic acid decarboxylase n=1 Tax=Kazachstania africana (strain ATCC 22294 / BCRC 22015 / CBS 2517 / CECT 1963 / NBRC 1671 / NRRL Y-8276) TaxID=1071382 RepID=H2B1K3_KAZAF|nr:hypothetical protein KAFR_0K01490 [Kazachstania africana CBS 2517]CCF60503.1 hypothetical protein KAFR_0K01490 [Kazachstania africana CBS 2517]
MVSFDLHDLSAIVGKRLVYTYENGFICEIYIRNESEMDYRVHKGLVGGLWEIGQNIYMVRVGADVYKLSWLEPKGTDVSIIVNLEQKFVHGTIWYPRWVVNNPEKVICLQRDFIPQMEALRDAGPAYPTKLIDEFATLTFMSDCGKNNDEVINCPPGELPSNFPNNLSEKNLL